jgi:flagellar basal-body rod modification protein FlgD
MTTPISSVSAGAAAASAAGAAQKSLAGNFDTFLTLLTAQLRNQDPLSPMDSNEFTQQLVQFSQVEQQINSNKNLETLVGLTRARSGLDAMSYLGKTLTLTDGSNALRNGEASWDYTLDGQAAITSLTVTDAKGKIVYAARGETANGTHKFVWDGKNNAGNQVPDGAYTLTVKAALANGTPVDTETRSQGVVDEIDLSGSEPLLKIGPLGVPLSRAALVSGT